MYVQLLALLFILTCRLTFRVCVSSVLTEHVSFDHLPSSLGPDRGYLHTIFNMQVNGRKLVQQHMQKY